MSDQPNNQGESMSNEQNWPATNNHDALNKYYALVLKVAASEWVLTESDEYGPQPTHPCCFGCNHPSHGAPNVLAEVRAYIERLRELTRPGCPDPRDDGSACGACRARWAVCDDLDAILDGEGK